MNKCEACGAELDEAAETCPHCGRPAAPSLSGAVKASLRILIVAVILVVAIHILGRCVKLPGPGSSPDGDAPPAAGQAADAPVREPDPGAGDR